MISLKQKDLKEWQLKNFGIPEPEDMIIGMSEELGELAHYFLKGKQGIREAAHGNDVTGKIADAFGDIIVFGTQLMTCLGMDAEVEVKKVIEEVLKRDFVNNPAGIGYTQHKENPGNMHIDSSMPD